MLFPVESCNDFVNVCRQRELLELQVLVESLARETDDTSLDSRTAMPSLYDEGKYPEAILKYNDAIAAWKCHNDNKVKCFR